MEYSNWDVAICAAHTAWNSVDRLLPPPGIFSNDNDIADNNDNFVHVGDNDPNTINKAIKDNATNNDGFVNLGDVASLGNIVWKDKETGIQSGDDSKWSLVQWRRKTNGAPNHTKSCSHTLYATSDSPPASHDHIKPLFLSTTSFTSNDGDSSYCVASSDTNTSNANSGFL